MKSTTALLEFWEDQMKKSHTSSNYFFRKSPSHYHMMLLIMAHYKHNKTITVEQLKTRLFKTSRPKPCESRASFAASIISGFDARPK